MTVVVINLWNEKNETLLLNFHRSNGTFIILPTHLLVYQCQDGISNLAPKGWNPQRCQCSAFSHTSTIPSQIVGICLRDYWKYSDSCLIWFASLKSIACRDLWWLQHADRSLQRADVRKRVKVISVRPDIISVSRTWTMAVKLLAGGRGFKG